MLTHQVFAVANLVKVCLSIRQCKSSGNHIKLNPSACSLVSGLCFRSVRLSVRSMGLESCGEKTGISYFLTSMGGNCFRNVGNCKHTSSVGRGWSSGSQTPSQVAISCSGRVSIRSYLSFRRDTYFSALPCA